MINVEKLFNSNEISTSRFPHYIELHYQAFKSTWRRRDEATSRLCYLTWLLAYEHESPLLNFAKHDPPVVEFMLAHYKDENHQTWNISQLEFYFVENYKNEFISWGMPPLTYQTQNIYADWFKKNENFKRYFPYERKYIDPKTLFLTSSNAQDTGIDIIGFPLSPTGLGELTRSLISASQQLELNINIVNLDQHASQNNYPNFTQFISDQPKNKIRIFATPLQNVPVLLYTRGINYFKDSFNILNTAWEFEQRTNNLDSAFLILNEVWTLSHFIKPGFKNPESVPVKVLHCGVHDTQKLPSNRKKWNLPEETFLFLSAFDFNSYLKRKNPQLAIDSFIKAFAEKSNTALVIKCTNVDETSAEWIELVSIIKNHNNIYLINKTLGRDELIELLHSVDSFISLHRSEGFGYIIAESMKIGIPVICTGYSGNMDFCNSENSYLVDFELVAVKNGEYIQSEGLIWANPKIESAIQQMKLVLEDKNLRMQKVAAAQKKINTEFSISAISQQLKLHLTSLCEKENIEYKRLKRMSS